MYNVLANSLYADEARRQARVELPRSITREIERLHKLDRTHYDTPGSVIGCGCQECNRVRRIYGKRTYGWNRPAILQQLTLEIERRLAEPDAL